MKKLYLISLFTLFAFALSAQHNQVWVQNNSGFDFCVVAASYAGCVNGMPMITSPLTHIPPGTGMMFQGDPAHPFTTYMRLVWDDTGGGCTSLCSPAVWWHIGPAIGLTTTTMTNPCAGATVTLNWGSGAPCFDAVVTIN
ncbi:hypothetical protein KFE98_02125 [bacterium SCSIO 12741]|nr:hypothetical protein KFE98_02125 [bacterium SCSIO 12741]